jgi:hypothetical protein
MTLETFLPHAADRGAPISPDAPSHASPTPTETQTEIPVNIAHLCLQLHAAMAAPEFTQDTLLRQTFLLDKILYMLADKFEESLKTSKRYTDYTALDYALRVQKQCTGTLKAHGAIDYMQNLIHITPLPRRSIAEAGTPPSKTRDRTE